MNWANLLLKLKDKGLTYSEIGLRTDMSSSSVCDLLKKRSKNPNGNSALKLITLAQEYGISLETHPPKEAKK